MDEREGYKAWKLLSYLNKTLKLVYLSINICKNTGAQKNNPTFKNFKLRSEYRNYIYIYFKVMIPEQEKNIFDSTIKLLFSPVLILPDVTPKIEKLTLSRCRWLFPLKKQLSETLTKIHSKSFLHDAFFLFRERTEITALTLIADWTLYDWREILFSSISYPLA